MYNDFKRIVRSIFYFFHKPFYGSFGKRSVLMKPDLIRGKKNIFIGNHVTIRQNAQIECISYWNEKSENKQVFEASIVIGDGTTIERLSHITSAGLLSIGKNCVILERVTITNISHDYSDVGLRIIGGPLIVRPVVIGDNCFFGMDSKVFPGVTIGNNVIIGANSIVMDNIPPFSVCAGIPAKVIKKYDFDKKEWVKVNKG